ncbi:MBL fold metallo-hydrolase [Blastococcus sp. URHD0036]|uniref:MBL fold metallo-hydrolase n=1 Tax=Blastococcus sp. URHD0036 TaxID=1380356 RepID=UPI000495BA8E|nr:MBL fold metallo-hydrolase [Blastococcus sp. URHD0036]
MAGDSGTTASDLGADGHPWTGLGAEQEDWDRHPELLHDDGTVELTMGGLLLVGHDRVVLVDTGFGPNAMGPLQGGELPGNLAKAGFSPTDVTDVVFSHFHIDYIGWASVDGRPFFPSATYGISHVGFWVRDLDSIMERVWAAGIKGTITDHDGAAYGDPTGAKVRSCMIRDPEGTFRQLDEWVDQPPGGTA